MVGGEAKEGLVVAESSVKMRLGVEGVSPSTSMRRCLWGGCVCTKGDAKERLANAELGDVVMLVGEVGAKRELSDA